MASITVERRSIKDFSSKCCGTAGNFVNSIGIGIGEGCLSLLAGAHRFPRRCTHESPERRSPVAVLSTRVCVCEDSLFERVAVLRSAATAGRLGVRGVASRRRGMQALRVAYRVTAESVLTLSSPRNVSRRQNRKCCIIVCRIGNAASLFIGASPCSRDMRRRGGTAQCSKPPPSCRRSPVGHRHHMASLASIRDFITLSSPRPHQRLHYNYSFTPPST